GVDLLICEATYLLPGDEARAAERDHLHLSETCRIAADAQAGRLWLTHFSQAVPDPFALADQVHALCPLAELGRDGMTTVLRFRDDGWAAGRRRDSTFGHIARLAAGCGCGQCISMGSVADARGRDRRGAAGTTRGERAATHRPAVRSSPLPAAT